MFTAVAIDLDGTTLRPDGELSARTSSTLLALADAGIWIVPATARPPDSTFEKVAVSSCAVCCNGALLVDRHRGVLWEQTFDRALLVERVSRAMATIPDLGFGVRAHDQLIGNHRYFELRGQPPPSGSIQIDSPNELRGLKVHALSFRSEDTGSAALATALGPDAVRRLGDYSISAPDVLDVAPNGVTKATGLAELGQRVGFGAEDVVAYGDMPNDIPMLTWARLGLAVREAPPRVQAAADAVIGSCGEDGVADHLIATFGLGRQRGDSGRPGR